MSQKCKQPLLINSDYQQYFLQQLFCDTIGFAGCALIRRAIGVARISDFEHITSDTEKDQCKSMALTLGQALINQRQSLQDIHHVQTLIQRLTAPSLNSDKLMI